MRVFVAVLAIAASACAVPRTRRTAVEEETFCNNGKDVCVPYYLCNDGVVNTDGSNLIDIRIGPSKTEQECPRFLDVCCHDPTRVPPPPPKYRAQCGRRNEEGVNARIQGFQENQAQFGEFPWMAAVLRKEILPDNEELNHYVCGGSLIHSQVVLTAAHCVSAVDPQSLNVRLGEWDTQKAYELYPHQDIKVHYVLTHADFNPKNLHSDVALLFLEKPAILDSNVDTICLPDQGYQFSGTCWASGWGKDYFGKEGVFQNILKEVSLPTVEHPYCQETLRNTRLGKRFILDPSFMCAGGVAGVDTCTGDGGSPLVCQDEATKFYFQAGIVAWGIGCGEKGIPGVYADVAKFRDWITYNVDDILFNEFNFDNTGYWS